MSLPFENSLVRRAWYSGPITKFVSQSDDDILSSLVRGSAFPILESQRDSWLAQLPPLRAALNSFEGDIFLEFTVPRMGKRIDAVLLIRGILIVVEFKVGAKEASAADRDQAYDYAADMKYFHEGSHDLNVVPILVASEAPSRHFHLQSHPTIQGLFRPVCTNFCDFPVVIRQILSSFPENQFNAQEWRDSRYCPTPTIIEAARALYAGHGVADISRSDAGAINLQETSDYLCRIIEESRKLNRKSICFVTGVPGAGKTLVGLNIATQYSDVKSDLHSVFLSGNGPLVNILREALARDTVRQEKLKGNKMRLGDSRTRVKAFIQNVHHFRDECIRDSSRPPVDHVALFDEAQRAWNLEQTAAFMKRKKGIAEFGKSESEFLISCMDRRPDWAVVVCLVGGGQEIHVGEAGIAEWVRAIRASFPHWHVHISPHLLDAEYGAGQVIETLKEHNHVSFSESLHLKVSMRSFRSERVSEFVKVVLDCELEAAKSLIGEITENYPIFLTRDLDTAKQWLRSRAVGTERYGIVVSSQAERLKPLAMDIRTPVNPVKWFLDPKDDVRSSYYLEDVATEFHVQGLELDWACVSWDGDFRHNGTGWAHHEFHGNRWKNIKKAERKIYQKNAYRVLLTRARQGMVIFIPQGDTSDPTRNPAYYDGTFNYLRSVGIPVLQKD